MTAPPPHERQAQTPRWFRLLVRLGGLILVSAAVTAAVWWGRGWRGLPAGRRGAEPLRPLATLGGPRKVRPPARAGQFYPADSDELFDQVGHLLAAAPTIGIRGVRAVLAPHAGYAYSGEVAAASFREIGVDFRRVFLLAANHNGRADFAGVSLPDVTHYAIPGAEIPLAAVVKKLRQQGLFTCVPEAHTMHMIEAELPFLYQLHGRPAEPDFTIVPMILGRMDKNAVEQLAEILNAYAEPTTRFVFSVDLSHYYPGATARRLDGYTIDALMSRDEDALTRARTDGDQVLETMVALAARRGWEPTLLMRRNSGDVSGDNSRVVGYAAIVFHEPFSLTSTEKAELLAFARASVEEQVRHGRAPEPDREWISAHPIFRIPRAVFVTLKKNGKLRGCVGEIVSHKPLYAGVRSAAVNAAVHDARFTPVTAAELPELSVSISVLGYPQRVTVSQPEEYLEVLHPGKDGVILVHDGKRSTFLPQVWDELPDARQFLTRLSLKQGSPPDAWRSPSTVLYRYGAYVFGEKPSSLSAPG